MSGWVSSIASQSVLASVPLIIAGVGELIAETAGVINVGIEGLMLCGCITAFAVGCLSGSGSFAIISSMTFSAALAGIFACATVWARVDQIVCGMALNLIAIGGSGLVWQALQVHGHENLPASAAFRPDWAGQYAIVYVVLIGILITGAVRRWFYVGVIIKALGEAPDACRAAGISVIAWRIGCVVTAGALSGLAGAYISIMRDHQFVPDMTGGRGFLVLALVILGRWRLDGLVAAALFFGCIESFQQHWQGRSGGQVVPYQLLKALPYLAALAALTFLARTRSGPRCLGQPYP